MDDDSNSGAFIAAAGAVAASGINAYSQYNTNQKKLELARYSYDRQMEAIREQNEYNSPANQMARYQEAGLNPNLIYSQGNSGNQSGIAEYQAPNIEAPQISSHGVTAAMDALKLSMQMRQLQADLKIKDEQAYAIKQQALGYQQDFYSKFLDNAVKQEIVGVKPGLVMTDDEMAAVRAGRALQRYDAELKVERGKALYQEAQTELAKSSAAKNNYFLSHLGPAQEALMESQRAGRDIENEIRNIEKKTYEDLSALGGPGNASTLVRLFIDFLKLAIR